MSRADFMSNFTSFERVLILAAMTSAVLAIVPLISPSDNHAETQRAPIVCKPGEDEKATKGVFCSKDFGFKLTVPKTTVGKLTSGENVKTASRSGSDVTSIHSYTFSEQDAPAPDTYFHYAFEVSEYPRQPIAFLSKGQVAAFTPVASSFFYEHSNKEVEYRQVNGISVYMGGIDDEGLRTRTVAFVKNKRLFLIELVTNRGDSEVPASFSSFSGKADTLASYMGESAKTFLDSMKLEIGQ